MPQHSETGYHGKSIPRFRTAHSGLGNGVLQDILFMVGVNPKTKLNLLTDEAFGGLYHSGKDTLRAMTDEGGRSTEKIFSGARGGTRSCCPVKRINSPAPIAVAGLSGRRILAGISITALSVSRSSNERKVCFDGIPYLSDSTGRILGYRL